jgi:NAD(P)-dependent dehydrogenase (short-subunit alcohol dehydrogenase family)
VSHAFSSFDLTGKVALVTGGYGGIGQTLCHALGAAGAKIAVTGRNGDKAKALAAKLQAEGVGAYGGAFDALSVSDTNRMADDVAAHFGRIDILVNTVSEQREEKADAVTEANFDHVIDSVTKSSMFQSQAVARHMTAQGTGGKIIHFGSVRSQLALRGRGFAAYCAAKGGLAVLVKQLAAEWADRGIYVNMVAPTFVRTAQAAKWLDDPEFYKNIVARIPLGRVADTADIVGPVLFFASAASDFVTGQTLYVDGGVTATQ